MPSVQWGSTNSAALVFTPISAALGALSAAGGSLAILWQPTSPSDGAGLLNTGGTTWHHALQMASHLIDDDGVVAVNAPTNVTTAHWFISVVDWPTNASPALERFHWIDLTAAGAWGHENSAVNNGGNHPGPGTTGKFRIGDLLDQRMTSGTKIALVAAWNTPLGDTNAALLSTAKRTSDWYNNPAGKPIFLSEVTSLAPVDVLGASTFGASVTTGLTVGGNPDGGWLFDGPGPYVVQSTGNYVTTSAQTSVTTPAFPQAVTPGNMIVVGGYANNIGGGTPQAPTITDSKGNTWPTTLDKFQAGVPKDPSEFMYYAHLIVPAGGTGFTVTATYHSAGVVSAGSNRIFAVEVGGVDTMDGAAVLANGTSATAAANFPVSAGVPSYIAALAVSENGITAAVPGWNIRVAEGSETLYDQIALATGTKALSVAAGGSNQWCIIGAAFYKASAGGPVAITPVAAAATSATVLVTAGVIEGPTIVSATVTQATVRVTAPALLSPVAASTTQASATVVAPGIQFLVPTAQTATAATALTTAGVQLTAIANAATQATATVTAATVATPQALTPTAQAATSATASATAAVRLSPVSAAATQALATVGTSLVPFLVPAAQASASAIVSVTAPVRLAPSAQAQTQAAGLVTVPMPLAPVAASATQATSPIQAPVVLTPVAAAQTSATAQTVVTVALAPAAATATSATALVGSLLVPLLVPVAQATSSASSQVGVPIALTGLNASSTTRATVIVAAAALVSPEPPLYADVFSNRHVCRRDRPGQLRRRDLAQDDCRRHLDLP